MSQVLQYFRTKMLVCWNLIFFPEAKQQQEAMKMAMKILPKGMAKFFSVKYDDIFSVQSTKQEEFWVLKSLCLVSLP